MINRAEEAYYQSLRKSQNAAFIHERVGDIEFVHVYGDIDMVNADELEGSISAAYSPKARILADFTNCRYLDSTGLAVLVRAKQNLGEKFSISVAAGSNIERILKLTSLYNVLI